MRKNGCPTNIRDWQVDVMSRASTTADPVWIRVKGLTSLTPSRDADTEDNSSADSLWSEPYVTKRSGSVALEGKPVYDRVSGAHDPGQAELDYLATVGGCDGDGRIRIVDPCGHSEILDVIVTSAERSVDESSETISWDMEIVGEPEMEPYVQVSNVTTDAGSNVSIAVGATKTVNVTFTPTTASNQKYSVASADTTKVKVDNIDGLSFDIIGVAATTSAVNVVVKTINNAKTVSIPVTVTSL